MTVYARISNGVVAELVTLPNGITPAEAFNAAIASTFEAVPSGVTPAQGWTYNGATYAAPVPAVLTAAQLIAYATARQQLIAAGGVSVNVGTSGSPVDVECSMDPTSLIQLQGAASIAAATPSQTFAWVPSTGSPMTLTAAQITTMFGAVSAFIQSTFTELAAVIAAISAGTITTKAGVDAASWPVNS
jgi:hypothetical protein